MEQTTLDTSAAEQLQDLVISSNDASCAVTLRRHHRTATAASSNPEARLFDEIQHHYGDGPASTRCRFAGSYPHQGLQRPERNPRKRSPRPSAAAQASR